MSYGLPAAACALLARIARSARDELPALKGEAARLVGERARFCANRAILARAFRLARGCDPDESDLRRRSRPAATWIQ